MKATIKHTTHANLKPGDPVEVTGYCARVTATFDDATPNAKPKEETREIFFGLDDLSFPGHARPQAKLAQMAEIPADLPKPPATPARSAKPPTIAPQSAELAMLAEMLEVLRGIYAILEEGDARRRGES
jgi:hypothetical protein